MSFIYLAFDLTPHISFHCKLVPVQYREYINMVYSFVLKLIQTLLIYGTVFSCTFEGRGAIQISNPNANKEKTTVEASNSDSWVLENTYPPPPPAPNPVHWIF